MPPFDSPLRARQVRMNMLDLDCLAEIRRWLNKFRFDPNYRGPGQRVPLRQLAELCAVSRQTLYDLIRGDRLGIEPATRDRINAAIVLIDQRGLRWRRKVIRQPTIMKRIAFTPTIIEWQAVMPDGSRPPPIPQRHLSEKKIAAQAAAGERHKARAKERAQQRAQRANQAKLQLP
jgi:hypothetical protein